MSALSHFTDKFIDFAVTTTVYETEQQLSSAVLHYLGGAIPDTDCKPYASKVEKHKA